MYSADLKSGWHTLQIEQPNNSARFVGAQTFRIECALFVDWVVVRPVTRQLVCVVDRVDDAAQSCPRSALHFRHLRAAPSSTLTVFLQHPATSRVSHVSPPEGRMTMTTRVEDGSNNPSVI